MTTHRNGTSPRRFRARDQTIGGSVGPVLLLTLIFFVHFVARQVAGPLLPAMESELGLRHAQSGLFIFSMGCGFFVSQIASAYLAGAWGYRRCILLSLGGAAAAAAVMALLDSAPALYAGFFALGVAGGLYVPSGISLITVLVRPRDWGKAMGIHELAPNLALIAVPFLATAAVTAGSWRTGYLALASALALLAAAHAVWGVDVDTRPSAPNLESIREIAANRSFWQLGFLLSLAVGVETGVYAMLPLYLVNDRGFELASANQLLGTSRIPGLFVVLLAGWITDRLGPRNTIVMALGLTGAAVTLLGLGPDGFVVPCVFLQAAAAACLFPPILSVASGISTAQNRALTLSLSLAVAPVLGGGLIPAGIALAGDLGSFGLGMAAAGLLTAAGTAAVPAVKPGADRR